MESEGSTPRLHVLAICPYPDPDRSSPCPHPISWRSILILSSHLRLVLPSCLFPPSFATKTLYAPLLSPIPATCQPTSFFNLITQTILVERYRWWCSLLCSFLHYLVTSSLSGPNIFPSILFLDTVSLWSFLNVSDQVSQPYKTTGKIIVLYILTFILWIANRKTKDSAPNDSSHSLPSICS